MSPLGSVRLGRSGVSVPRVVLGTATFGLQCDEKTSASIIARAAGMGITWLDTSTSYPLGSGPESVGVTEELLGRVLGSRTDDYFVASKVYNRTGPQPWRLGLSRHHLVAAVEGSLRRLRRDHLDLLQLHRWDAHTPVEETLAALDDLVRAGKVRYVGCCNFLAYQLAKSLVVSDWRRLPRIQTVQVRYNLLMRGAEMEMLRLCEEEEVSALAFNVLAGGLLTGKYDRASDPSTTARFGTGDAGQRYRDRYWKDETFDVIARLTEISRSAEVRLPALATAWVMHRPGIAASIIGASKPEHLDAVDEALTTSADDLFAELTAATSAQVRHVPELEFESS